MSPRSSTPDYARKAMTPFRMTRRGARERFAELARQYENECAEAAPIVESLRRSPAGAARRHIPAAWVTVGFVNQLAAAAHELLETSPERAGVLADIAIRVAARLDERWPRVLRVQSTMRAWYEFAEAHRLQKSYAEALRALSRAEELVRGEPALTHDCALLQLSRAHVYHATDRSHEAVALLIEAREVFDEHADSESVAQCQRMLAEVESVVSRNLTSAIRASLRRQVQLARAVAIRRFFLDPQETYTAAQLAEVWQVPVDDVRVLFHDDLASWNDDHPHAIDALPITWTDAVTVTAKFNMLRAVDVENALSADFERVRPPSWRTVPFIISLPLWLIDAIETDLGIIALAPSNATVAMRVERAMLDLFEEKHSGLFRGPVRPTR